MVALTTATWASALASAFLTGSLAKYIDFRTRTKLKQVDVSNALRDDLYTESHDLRERIENLRDRLEKTESEWRDRICKLETDRDSWRERYYILLAELNPMRGALRAAEEKIKRMEASDLRRNPPAAGPVQT